MYASAQVQKLAARKSRTRARVTRTHGPDPLARIDDVVGSTLGVDLRLIYGLAVPMLAVVGLIIALVTSPSYVLLVATLVPELAFLYMVVVKILKVLEDSGDAEVPSEVPSA